MRLPKMIVFDYGGTLEHVPQPDTMRGYGEIFKHVKLNKNNVTLKQLNDFGEDLFEKLWKHRHMGFEIHEWNFLRFVFEYLELELDISIAEADILFMNYNYPFMPIPNIEKLLDYLHERGIRSAVISNITCSGEALEDRIKKLLPGHNFEFIIATSEYVIRKPNPMIFELACKKAGLDVSEVWYCGDGLRPDVEGSYSAGLFPVWYDNEDYTNPWRNRAEERAPDIPHLHISDWTELINVLEELGA